MQTWTFLDLLGCCKYLQNPIAQLEVDKMIISHGAIGNGREHSETNHLIFLHELNGKVVLQTVSVHNIRLNSRYLDFKIKSCLAQIITRHLAICCKKCQWL